MQTNFLPLGKQNRQSSLAFQKGLTVHEIITVKNMGCREYENIVSNVKTKYGINADVGGSNTVAFCLEKVAEIMSKAGFKLPKNFVFAPTSKSALGTYYPQTDTVLINSNHSEFNNLETQNLLEESQGSFHPDTKHFLHTYLHEFSHAAHFHNLCEKLGFNEGWNAFMGYLSNYTTADVIIGPINNMIRKNFPKIAWKIIDKVFPPENGLYSKMDLTEYFAEQNARKLAIELGDSFLMFSLSSNFASQYKGFPSEWSFDTQKNILQTLKCMRAARHFAGLIPVLPVVIKMGIDTEIAIIFENDINYLNGEIWNGNIDSIKAKSLAFNNQNM